MTPWLLATLGGVMLSVSCWIISRPGHRTRVTVPLCLLDGGVALALSIANAVLWTGRVPQVLAVGTYLAAAAWCLACAHRASVVPWRGLRTRHGREFARARWRVTTGRDALVIVGNTPSGQPIRLPESVAPKWAILQPEDRATIGRAMDEMTRLTKHPRQDPPE